MPGVVWIKSYISESEGKTYCEYEAPNPEMLLEHARRLGISADRVTLISVEVNPAMFSKLRLIKILPTYLPFPATRRDHSARRIPCPDRRRARSVK